MSNPRKKVVNLLANHLFYMQKEPTYTLQDFSPEEGKQITADIDAVLAKYSAHFVIVPTIQPNGTLSAKAELFKKVELIPKEQGVPSPFTENGGNDNATTEEKPGTPEAK